MIEVYEMSGKSKSNDQSELAGIHTKSEHKASDTNQTSTQASSKHGQEKTPSRQNSQNDNTQASSQTRESFSVPQQNSNQSKGPSCQNSKIDVESSSQELQASSGQDKHDKRGNPRPGQASRQNSREDTASHKQNRININQEETRDHDSEKNVQDDKNTRRSHFGEGPVQAFDNNIESPKTDEDKDSDDEARWVAPSTGICMLLVFWYTSCTYMYTCV